MAQSDNATRAQAHTVSPHLICNDASAAIEFYKKAFGATEMMRLPGPDGKLMHASVQIGDSMVMLVDEMKQYNVLGPLSIGNSPVTIHLNVPDVDAVFSKAVAAGAKTIMPVADMFWGDRYGKLQDPFGHMWSIATHQRDMTMEEIKAAGMKAMGPGCPEASAKAQ